jgi:MarR family transcriptional regulator for hemolysin
LLEQDFETSIGYWGWKVSRAFERALNEELTPHGITYRQWQVLGWLALEGELSQGELADKMQIEAPTLVRILDRMERDGWIERHPDESDRRKKFVRPTPRVEPIWEQILAAIRRVRARATEGMDPQVIALVRQTLVEMNDNLVAVLATHPSTS